MHSLTHTCGFVGILVYILIFLLLMLKKTEWKCKQKCISISILFFLYIILGTEINVFHHESSIFLRFGLNNFHFICPENWILDADFWTHIRWYSIFINFPTFRKVYTKWSRFSFDFFELRQLKRIAGYWWSNNYFNKHTLTNTIWVWKYWKRSRKYEHITRAHTLLNRLNESTIFHKPEQHTR